ncbi:helix-turn-helix transcriptional regulator [Snodgrassella communis]|uniref:helix-turn-helix transcriptional regulator n=2 Tax=Snodgrassella communis TaxID=2946699 RepID=UPI00192AD0A1|nr:hypothetical protein [Snodgrassella communis]
MQPRLLRVAQAAAYCGCSINHFKAHIAPHIPAQNWLFENGSVYDKHDIDKFIEDKKTENLAENEKKNKNASRGKRLCLKKGNTLWPQKDCQDLYSATESGTSTSNIEAKQFAEALTQVRGKRRKLS